MKISHDELQAYFKNPLPSADAIAGAFTMRCFEIESVEGDVLDIKVLPNRAADCSAPAGIALELSAILDMPLAAEPSLSYAARPVETTLSRINALLGSDFTAIEAEDVFRRLRFKWEKEGERYRVCAPEPRTDVTIPEDIAEEVGRILGYDRIGFADLPALSRPPAQARFRGIERMKDMLLAEGYSEVSTQSFEKKGDIYLANPLDKTRPALRTSLKNNLDDALARAKLIAPLVLAPGEKPKLFEVGTVFPKAGEYMELRMTERVPAWGDTPEFDNLTVAKLEEFGMGYEPVRYELGAFEPFSAYPFIVRDVAAWMPGSTDEESIRAEIRAAAGGECVRCERFDRFEKDARVSLGFRLVLQAPDRTLTDEEANAAMEKVHAMLAAKGFEIR